MCIIIEASKVKQNEGDVKFFFAIGCWLLADGFWLLAFGFILNTEPGTRNPEPGTLNPEPGTKNIHHKSLPAEPWPSFFIFHSSFLSASAL
jgi:hypothetical protein